MVDRIREAMEDGVTGTPLSTDAHVYCCSSRTEHALQGPMEWATLKPSHADSCFLAPDSRKIVSNPWGLARISIEQLWCIINGGGREGTLPVAECPSMLRRRGCSELYMSFWAGDKPF